MNGVVDLFTKIRQYCRDGDSTKIGFIRLVLMENPDKTVHGINYKERIVTDYSSRTLPIGRHYKIPPVMAGHDRN